MIEARLDQEWFEKAKDEMAKLGPLHVRGDVDHIAHLLESPEYLRYERARCAKAGKWQTEGTLSIEPPIEI
jgi:hypothetical protein